MYVMHYVIFIMHRIVMLGDVVDDWFEEKNLELYDETFDRLTTDFVIRHFAHESSPDIDNIIGRIKQMGVDEMWNDISPIWYRPNAGGRAYPFDMLQVVGHIPVKMMEFIEDNFCVVDTFSTYKGGTPYGNQRFVKVNTVEKTVHQLMAL